MLTKGKKFLLLIRHLPQEYLYNTTDISYIVKIKNTKKQISLMQEYLIHELGQTMLLKTQDNG